MRYKILHLPTGTYMYRDTVDTYTMYFFSEYEISKSSDDVTDIFKSKAEALRYIEDSTTKKLIQFSAGEKYPYSINYKCHFELIKVKDEM